MSGRRFAPAAATAAFTCTAAASAKSRSSRSGMAAVSFARDRLAAMLFRVILWVAGTYPRPRHRMPQKPLILLGLKRLPNPTETWHIVAGPALTANQFHAATVPDGEIVDGVPTWEGGSYQRIEAQNRRLLDRYFAELEAEACRPDAAASLNHCSACGREDDLTDRANPTLCYPCLNKRKVAELVLRPDLAIPADLSIPPFLDRRPSTLKRAA